MSTRTSKRKQAPAAGAEDTPVTAARTRTTRTTAALPAGPPAAAAAAAGPRAKKSKAAGAQVKEEPEVPVKVEEDAQSGGDDEPEEIAAPPARKQTKPARKSAAAAPLPTPAPAPTPAAVPAKSAAAAKNAAQPKVKAEPAAADASDSDVEELPQVKSEAEEDEEEAAGEDDEEAVDDGEDDEDVDMAGEDDEDDEDDVVDDSEVEDMGSDSEDDSQGEEDDEDAAEDEENAGLKTEKPAKPAMPAGGAAKDGTEAFGSALTSLLSKPLPQSVLEGRQAPVLVADRTLAARHALPSNPLRKARREASERRLARRYMQSKDHVAVPAASPVEKKLMRIATKGVVTLFNAVAKQQKELKQATMAQEEGEKSKVSVSQSGFLELLKSEGDNVAAATASNSLPTPATSKTMGIKKEVKKETPAAGGAGWKVLQDDYLMGQNNKLTDWDKVESSEEEEEEDE